MNQAQAVGSPLLPPLISLSQPSYNN